MNVSEKVSRLAEEYKLTHVLTVGDQHIFFDQSGTKMTISTAKLDEKYPDEQRDLEDEIN